MSIAIRPNQGFHLYMVAADLPNHVAQYRKGRNNAYLSALAASGAIRTAAAKIGPAKRNIIPISNF